MGKYLLSILFSLSIGLLYSQTTEPIASTGSAEAYTEPKPIITPKGSTIFKPTFGLGAGMFSFYGDVNPGQLFQSPSTSRITFDLTVSQKLNSFLQFNFYALFGKLGVSEDYLSRNTNFESQISLGGVSVQYNFEHLIRRQKQISPFVSIGVEGFEFLSKTDLFDKNGNKYYYWSDGAIKNLAENSANASSAINLVRDYSYESDIRERNEDGFGKYAERSFALPVGVGAILHLGERVDVKFHATMHFTFTDYIDGITDKSKGVRAGNSSNDNFLVTGVSMHWDLLGKKEPLDTIDESWFANIDFGSLDAADTDTDGIRDTIDKCPGTPAGAPVDAFGCPTDSDSDGVLDYADKEIASKAGAIVDQDGIALSDSIIKRRHQLFTDTTGEFAEVIAKFHGEYDKSGNGVLIKPGAVQGGVKTPEGNFIPDEYTVLLGVYRSGLAPATMSKFLSIRDIETTLLPDSSIAYTVGHYSTYAQAQNRKKDALKNEINDAKVVYKKDGQFIEATRDIIGEHNSKNAVASGTSNKGNKNNNVSGGINREDSILVANTKGLVFRIQLGAYKRRLSKNVFKNVNDLIEIKTEDGLYKYMTGAFEKFADAANHRANMGTKGYASAFITAYKDGKRVTLASSGATPVSKKATIKENINEPEKAISTVDKKLVVFKVQIGVFKSEPPADKLAKFKALKDKYNEESTSTGLTRYTVGSYNDYNEAVKLKAKMQQQGLDDAFVIAFFNGQYITVQEGLELTK